MPGVEPLPPQVLPWQDAWQRALYGPHGFYSRGESPVAHFRTSSHVPLFAEAIARLASDVDAALGEPHDFTVVDVGAGRGELLTGLVDLVPQRWRLVAVDLVGGARDLDERIEWASTPPQTVTGLVMAHELLDVVPCPVVEVDDDLCIRDVLVESHTGVEELGPVTGADANAWLATWWPVAEPGERAEVGSTRDAYWRGLVTTLARGAALAVDYSHSADDRGTGRWGRGSLVGHRRGRVVPAVADGSCDLTAHVALDACAAAASDLVDLTLLTSQREAVSGLGISAALPDADQALAAPTAYAEALQRASQARELTDPTGLGAFGWLLQLKGVSPAVRGPASGR